jgi:hypothetical protein
VAGRPTGNVTQEALTGILAERFSIVRELGRGGMATVFLATDHVLDREVALKVFDPAAGGADAEVRFMREVALAARLVHPLVVPLLASGVSAGHRFEVMPVLGGETLRTRLARTGPLPIAEVVAVAIDLCEALGFAHAMGIVHRDLKPENVFLEGTRAVLADFGSATAAGSMSGMRLTATGMVLGTAAYMSPEQGMGRHDLDGRSDLYALGCLLFELLTGAVPFTGINVMAVVGQHVNAPVPDVGALRPDVPPALGVLLQALLAKAPAQRPATAGEVLRWLRPLAAPGRAVAVADDPVAQAAALLKRGHADAALAPLRAALAHDAHDLAALELMAIVAHRAGMPGEAAAARRTLLELRGQPLRLVALDVDLKAQGWTVARERDLERECQELLARARKEDPFAAEAAGRPLAEALILALAERGRWTEAMDWVARGAQQRPAWLARVLRELPITSSGLAVDPRYAPLLRAAGLEEQP